MELFQIKNIALFIDFENIHNDAFDVERLVEKLKERGRLIIKRAYADWGRFAKSKQTMLFNSVELVEMPANSYRGKNSSDIKLTIDALETALSRPYIDTFVVVSGDSDFTPLISKLRELDRYVIVVSNKEHTSKLLKGYCDELIYLSALMNGGEEKLSLQTGYVLLRRAVDSLENVRGEARSSLVKSQMVRLDPSFSEENYGYKQFRRFLEQAERDGIIRLKALGDGENRVSLPGAGKPAGAADKSREPAVVDKTREPAAPDKTRDGSAAEKTRDTVPAVKARDVASAEPAEEAAPVVAAEPAPQPVDVENLAGSILLGVALSQNRETRTADLSDLAHCCKRLDPQLTPDRYGVPKSRGFKGLVQLVQDHGYVTLNYAAEANRHLISLTEKGADLLRNLNRPARFEEIRYQTLLNHGDFRARLLNEKQVHNALTAFLDQQAAQLQPASIQNFLVHARTSLNTQPASSIPRILKAFEGIGVIGVDSPGPGGAWEEAVIARLEPWKIVVERIVQWHVGRLKGEVGDQWRKDVYFKILQEENNADLFHELGLEILLLE